MLLKWLFTLLAIIWLYEAITRISRERRNTRNNNHDRRPLDDRDYTDYEELDSRRKQDKTKDN
jgi:hypothetical protein